MLRQRWPHYLNCKPPSQDQIHIMPLVQRQALCNNLPACSAALPTPSLPCKTFALNSCTAAGPRFKVAPYIACTGRAASHFCLLASDTEPARRGPPGRIFSNCRHSVRAARYRSCWATRHSAPLQHLPWARCVWSGMQAGNCRQAAPCCNGQGTTVWPLLRRTLRRKGAARKLEHPGALKKGRSSPGCFHRRRVGRVRKLLPFE